MKKRGFTLIEIIISISLIAIIGTISVVSIVSLRKVKVENLLESNSKVLNNALEVYLEKHPEVTNNVNNNFKGAVVTLQVLKDEGLIDIKGLEKTDYEDNYYLLSNSILADGSTYVSDANKECDNNILSVQTVSSWDLENLDKSKIIYICPRNTNDNTNDNSNNANQSLIDKNNYIVKGENPNNYVELSVNSVNEDSSWAWWPSGDNKNLWRIISIDSDGRIKLIYHDVVGTNNQYNYYGYCRNKNDISNKTISKGYNLNDTLKNKLKDDNEFGNYYCNISQSKNCYGRDIGGSGYFRYSARNVWSSSEIISEYSEENLKKEDNDCISKKNTLFEQIDNNIKNQIIETKYDEITVSGNKVEIKMKLGFLTQTDYNNSKDSNGKTWLNNNNVWKNIPAYYKAQEEDFSPITEKFDGGGTGTYYFYLIEGHTYQPVIVLNRNVELKRNSEDNCSGRDGSLECPYRLKVE